MRYDIQPVSAACANDWLAGKFYVGDELFAVREIVMFPREVVFVNHIGSDKVAALNRIRQLGDAGATWIVAHVANPVIRKNLEARGMVVAYTEKIEWQGQTLAAWRMVGNPAAFGAWLNKLDHGVLIGL